MKNIILRLVMFVSIGSSLHSMQEESNENTISQDTQKLLNLYSSRSSSKALQQYIAVLDQASTKNDKMNALSNYIYHDLKHKLKTDTLDSLQEWIGDLVSTREGRARLIREPVNIDMKIRRNSELELMKCKYLHFAQLIYKICALDDNTLQSKGYKNPSIVYLKSTFSNSQQSEATISHILGHIETYLEREYCARISKNIVSEFAQKVTSGNGKYVDPLDISPLTFTNTLKAIHIKD